MNSLCISLILALLPLLLHAQSIDPHDRGAGEVNGVKIDASEYEQRVADAVERLNQQQGDVPEGGAETERKAREEVWNQMVDEALIEHAAISRGVNVSDEDARKSLLDDPPEYVRMQFNDSLGLFQPSLYQEFMKDVDGFLAARQMEPTDIQRIKGELRRIQAARRQELLRKAIDSILSSSLSLTPAEALSHYRQERSQASGSIAFLDANVIPDDQVTVTEGEARGYFESHRNEFRQTARREIHGALFSPRPSREDSLQVADRLESERDGLARATTRKAKNALFDSWSQEGESSIGNDGPVSLHELPAEIQPQMQGAHAGSVIGPVWLADGMHLIEVVDVKNNGAANVRVQHILLNVPADGDDDSVRNVAVQIMKRAKSGESFNELAHTYSAEPGSVERGGDLGYFGKGMMVKSFEDACFKGKPGEILGPVKTEFGYHIIKVNDRGNRNFTVHDWKVVPQVSEQTIESLRHRAEDFRRRLTPGTSVDSLGKGEDVELVSSPVRRNHPVGGSMELSDFAYRSTLGAVSDVIDLGDGNFVVAQLSSIRNAGPMDFPEAKEEVMGRLRTRKKLAMLEDHASRLQSAASGEQGFTRLEETDPSVQVEEFGELFPTSAIPGVGADSALAAAIFALPVGTVSPVITGEHGHYILLVTNRIVPTESDFAGERDEFISGWLAQQREARFMDWIDREREEADIMDYRRQRR
jgi:parvulin-like peptidyl-prolyl isomerase